MRNLLLTIVISILCLNCIHSLSAGPWIDPTSLTLCDYQHWNNVEVLPANTSLLNTGSYTKPQ